MHQITLSEQLREVMTRTEWETIDQVLNGLKDHNLAEDIRLRLLAEIKCPNLRIRTSDPMINFYYHACMPYVQMSLQKLADPTYCDVYVEQY